MRSLKGEELKTIYPEIFEKVFGYRPVGHIPRTVIVQEKEGEIKGFVSGYLIDTETFYMAWGGSVDKFVLSRKFWAETEAEIKELGVKWGQTNVENINTTWQRMIMGLGWIPHGVKVTQGKILIEYYKEF
jgi:hypothetical protein